MKIHDNTIKVNKNQPKNVEGTDTCTNSNILIKEREGDIIVRKSHQEVAFGTHRQKWMLSRIPANVVGVDHVSHSSKNPGLQYVSLVQTTSKDTKGPSGCFVHQISVPPPQQVLHCCVFCSLFISGYAVNWIPCSRFIYLDKPLVCPSLLPGV